MTDYGRALRTLESRAQVAPFTADDRPSDFWETAAAAFALTRREELIDSAARAWQGQADKRAAVIGELGGNERLARLYGHIPQIYREPLLRAAEAGTLAENPIYRSMNPGDRRAFDHVMEYRERFPDRVPSDAELEEAFKAEAAELRKQEQFVMERGSGPAAFLGSAGAIMTDPLILLSLPIGASLAAERVGALSLARVFGRTAAIEGSVAAAVELPIQAEVHRFKREIESPWSWKNSAMNIVAAGVGGAALGGALGTGIEGTRRLLGSYREGVAAGTVRATPDTEDAARALEQIEHLHRDNPLRGPDADQAHETAFDLARLQESDHQRVDVADVIAGAEPEAPVARVIQRSENPAELVDLDPTAVRVDARTFQFKAGADAHGVTDALRDVPRFDRRLAGVVLVWERADGVQFIADGHQRVGLAQRALAAGQDPAEVRLNAFILREGDGITALDARRMAAVKNIAEGTGSAVDAAKILRDLGKLSDLALPPLPPRSALVRQARGLAQLEEEPFLQVINGVIPESYGALVGAATADGALQRAMIEVLRRTRPANEVQARSIVDQVRTEGVERRVTEDLFGEREIAESLYLERAQVLDQVLREARTDKATFGRLVAEAERIEETGANVLDRDANLRRIQEAKDATSQISALANARGPISDALTEAARRVRAGERPSAVASSVLEAARRAISAEPRGGAAPGGPRQVREAPEPRVEGGPQPISERLDPDAPNFGIVERHVLPEGDARLTPTDTIATPERVALREQLVDEHFAGKQVTPRAAGERPVAYVFAGGGASGKGTVKGYLRERGLIPPSERVIDIDADEIKTAIPEYGELLRAGDSRAGAVVHEESSLIARQVRERAEREGFDIVFDRTLGRADKARADIEGLKAAGYDVRVIGVTVDADVAMQRMVQRYNDTGRFVPPGEMMAAHGGFSRGIDDITALADDLLLFDNNVAPGAAPRLIARRAEDGSGLAIEDSFLYNRFRSKEVLNGTETTLRDVHARTLERQRRGSDVGRARLREGDPGTEGPRARSARIHPGDDITPIEFERTLEQARQLIDEQGDLVTVARLEADELGQIGTQTRPARDALNELDELERSYDHVRMCSTGRAA